MRTALIIDDDDSIREMLKTLVQEVGFTVHAFAESSSSHPRTDVVISDLVPLRSYDRAGARAYVTTLRERYPGAPIIVCTAHSAAVGDDIGADAVLAKPFTLLGLEEAIARVMR